MPLCNTGCFTFRKCQVKKLVWPNPIPQMSFLSLDNGLLNLVESLGKLLFKFHAIIFHSVVSTYLYVHFMHFSKTYFVGSLQAKNVMWYLVKAQFLLFVILLQFFKRRRIEYKTTLPLPSGVTRIFFTGAKHTYFSKLLLGLNFTFTK